MAKKLLNERTVRRFQKLAMVTPINEMYKKRDDEMDEAMHGKRDDEMEEGMYNKRDDEMEEGMYKRDDEVEEGMYKRDDENLMKEKEDEMKGDEPEMDMGDDKGGDMDGDLELTDEEAQAIIDLGTKLEQAMGGLDDMDMGDDKGMDMGGEEDMGDEDLMEALAGISYIPSQGEIVNEVAQRVARRLKEAKLHEAKLNRALGKRR